MVGFNQENQECQGWTKYDIQVMCTNATAEQHVLDVFEAFVEDPSDLQTTILANWEPSEDTDDVEPCGITITEKAEQRLPSIKTMPAFRPSETSITAPNVAISDGVSIVPANKLEAGKPYTIFVQNFPKGSKVNVKLLSGLKIDGPVVATINSFDDDGTSEISWTPTVEQIKGDGECVCVRVCVCVCMCMWMWMLVYLSFLDGGGSGWVGGYICVVFFFIFYIYMCV
jgi:hypothetical protein